MYTVTKSYRDLPAAHRQPNHEGHCRWIHGHNWGFDITFICEKLDPCGFVIDLGGLGRLKERLVDLFDHTLLLNADDPEVVFFLSEHFGSFAKVVLVPNCGMEGLAEFVFNEVRQFLDGRLTGECLHRGLSVISVTCFEDSKNSATYTL